MNAQRRFTRKIIYLVAIAILLLPLSYLSQPGSGEADQGGKLARLRSENELGQANLGQVDPTSATMRFASFGLHGLASSWLWMQATDAKNREDWTLFDATLEQIANFQPNFVDVWRFQAWNVSYNMSVRFDDYRDRYTYVVRGMKYLERGISYNDQEATLPGDLAWFTGNKIGKAEERRAFRRLFKADDAYHDPPAEEDWLAGTAYEETIRGRPVRDNWLLAHQWYLLLNDRKDRNEIARPRRSDPLFYRESAHSLIEYAEALAKDGEFGPKLERAWSNAADAWRRYGERSMVMRGGLRLRLLDYDVYRRRALKLLAEVDVLNPEWKAKRLEQYGHKLTEAQQEAWAKPWSDCDEDEKETKLRVAVSVWANLRDLRDDVKEDQLEELNRIIARYEMTIKRVEAIGYSRELVAYESWRVRCEVERTEDAIAAHQAIYEGDRAMRKAQIAPALEHYQKGIQHWSNVLDAYPVLLDDFGMTDDLGRVIEKYREVLRQNEEPFPDPFSLQQVLDKLKEEGVLQ